MQNEYQELNKLRQQLKKQEAKCKKEVDELRIKIQELELDNDARSEGVGWLTVQCSVLIWLLLPQLHALLIFGSFLHFHEDVYLQTLC